jgi:methyltransferase-like protein
VGNLYDEVPYPGLPLPQTHPSQLATLGFLHGLNPAPVERCRVLELGCSNGGNLIPMALELPESEFVGIDLSSQAIATGNQLIGSLSLKRIQLRQLDLMNLGADFGEFDYVIAHGLYSWVPAEVRDRILGICRDHLAPSGIAYISYNTYPGFHRREMFREMMLYHTRNVEKPLERVRQGIELVECIAQARGKDEVPRALLEEELAHFADSAPWYLYHDDLAANNAAFYFFDFIEKARKHGLQYLSEADFYEMQDHIYPENVTERLRRFAGDDVILREQYLDFIKGRTFRQTLLCREEVAVDRTVGPRQARRMHFASLARPVSGQPDLTSGTLEEFRGSRGAALKTDYPPAKSALFRLGTAWPQSLPFSDLASGATDETLAEMLWQAFAAGLVEVNIRAWRFVTSPGERPVASPLARLEAQSASLVTNQRHTAVELEDDTDRYLVMHLDGTRDRGALLARLAEFRRTQASGEMVTAEALEMRLNRLAQYALLIE